MNNTDNIIAIRKKNPDCAYEAFVQLMDKTQNYINDKARRDPELFTGISTPRLEAVKDYLSKPNDIAYFLDDYNPCLSRGGHRNLFDLWKKQIAMLVESQYKEARMEYWIDHDSVLEIKI